MKKRNKKETNLGIKSIYAIVTTQFEGMHFYKDASGAEEFLKHPHRHVFHLKVVIEQYHDNREIEFINFKRWLNKQLLSKDVNYRSCEMIANELCLKIIKKYGKRNLIVTVMEDNENGGIITYTFNANDNEMLLKNL